MLKSKTKGENLLQTVGCGGFLLGRPPFPQCALSIARQAASCNLDSHASSKCCGAGNIYFGSEAQIRISAPAPDSFIKYLEYYFILT
jgi:hypothetical protein